MVQLPRTQKVSRDPSLNLRVPNRNRKRETGGTYCPTVSHRGEGAASSFTSSPAGPGWRVYPVLLEPGCPGIPSRRGQERQQGWTWRRPHGCPCEGAYLSPVDQAWRPEPTWENKGPQQ